MALQRLSRLVRFVGACAVVAFAGLVPGACSLNPQPLPPDAPTDAGGRVNGPGTADSGAGKGGGGGGLGDATTPALDSGTVLGPEDSTAPPPAPDAGQSADGNGADGGVHGDGAADSAITDAGADDGALGAPCTVDNQCTGTLCLGGAFTGGYCSSPVAECSPGATVCGDAALCTKSGGVDVDGAAQAEFCLTTCQGPAECRQGYSCCYGATYAQTDGLMVCVPPSLCPDQ
jgi:hypothetical protein